MSLVSFFISALILCSNSIDINTVVRGTTNMKSVVVQVGPAETKICYQSRFDGVIYQFTTDEDNKVDFLNTWDVNFRLDNGLKIGDAYSEIKKNEIISEKFILGWGVMVEHISGWNIRLDAFGDKEKSNLDNNSKIITFFKIRKE